MNAVTITITPEQVDEIIEQLGSEDTAMDFFKTGSHIQPILPALSPDLPIWKTITLGKHRSGTDYLFALLESGYAVDDLASSLFETLSVH